MKETLTMLIILVLLSVVNGAVARYQNRKGKMAHINWFACGLCGVVALTKLIELIWN